MKMIRRGERGNVFTMLLGGIVLSGALSIALYQLMGGPVFSTVRLANVTAAQAQTQTVARSVIADAGNQTVNTGTGIPGDCDNDGYTEPKPFRSTTGAKPAGGGLIPLTVGSAVTDPWNTDYGYCVWDVGPFNDPALDNGCTVSNRLKGTPTPSAGNAASQIVMAIVSAGPDKSFQTSCINYDANSPAQDLVATSGDDVVTRFTYAEASQATTAGLWSLKAGAPTVAKIEKDLQIGDDTTKGTVTAATLTTTGKISAGGATVLGNQTTASQCDVSRTGLIRYDAGGSSALVRLAQATPVTTAQAASGTISFGTAPAAGNTVIVMVTGFDDTAGHAFTLADTGITDNQGGTSGAYKTASAGVDAACPVGGNQTSAKIFYRSNVGATAGTFTITVAPSHKAAMTIEAFEVSGLATVNPVDAANAATSVGASGATSTAVTTPTTTQAEGFAVGVIADCSNNANVNYAQGAGWTQDAVINNATTGTASSFVHKSTAAIGTVSHTWTHTAANLGQQAAALAVFKNASVSPSAAIEYCDGTRWNPIGTGGAGTWTCGTPCASKISELSDARVAYAPSYVLGLGQDALKNGTTGLSSAEITVVQKKSGQVSGTPAATGITVTLDANSTTGNQVIVLFTAQESAVTNTNLNVSGVTDNQGNTYTNAATSTNTFCKASGAHTAVVGIYHITTGFTAPGGGTKLAVTAKVDQVANMSMQVIELSGLTGTSVERAASGRQGSTGNTIAATVSNTLANPYELVVGGAAFCDTSGSMNLAYSTANPAGAHATDPTQGWVELYKDNTSSATHVGSSFVYRLLTSAIASGNASYTWATGTNTTQRSPWAIAAYRGTSTTQPAPILNLGTAAGYEALKTATTGYNNTALGYQAAKGLTTGGPNDALGFQALYNSTTPATTAVQNLGIGSLALKSLTTGTGNALIGFEGGQALTSANYVTGIGYQAFRTATNVGTTAQAPTGIGYQTLYAHNATTPIVAIGYQAAYNSTTLSTNLALGYQALFTNPTAAQNTAIGYQALKLTTGATEATAFGSNALAKTTGNQVTAFGAGALQEHLTSGGQTAFGYNALAYEQDDSGETAFGANALSMARKGASNTYQTAFGYNALAATTNGQFNTAFGSGALAANTGSGGGATNPPSTGNANTAIGYNALNTGALPGGETAIGAFAMQNDNAVGNTGIGFKALQANVSGTGNTGVGYQSLMNNTGSNNTAAGAFSLTANTSGSDNTAAGAFALYSNTTGSYNTASGFQSMYSNTIGSRNTAAGYQSLYTNTSGTDNSALGYQALFSNTTGTDNTAFGYRALFRNTTGIQNSAAGYKALYNNTTGTGNAAAGYDALHGNTTGSYNTAQGYRALYANTTGGYNTSFGAFSMMSSTADSYNTAAGFRAMSKSNAGGSSAYNTAVGHNAMVNNITGTNNTAYGTNALFSNGLGATGATPAIIQSATLHKGQGERDTSVSFSSLPTAGNAVVVAILARNDVVGYEEMPEIPMIGGVTDNQGNTYTQVIASHWSLPVETGGARVFLYAAYNVSINAPGDPFTITIKPEIQDFTNVCCGGTQNNYTTQWGAMEVSNLASVDVADQVGTWRSGYLYCCSVEPVKPVTTVRAIGPMSQPNELAVSIVGILTDSGAGSCNISAEAGWTTVYNDDWCNTPHDTDNYGYGFGVAYKAYGAVTTAKHTWTTKVAERGMVSLIATFKGATGATPGSGSNNAAFGAFALGSNTTGSNNTAFGAYALYNNVTGSNNTAYGYMAGPAGGNSFNVTGAGSGAGGVVRLTLESAVSMTTGDSVTVGGVTGTTEANGTFTITVIDTTHIDLQGTAYANAYVSGGYACVGGCGALSNTTALGANARVYKSNTVRIGDVNVTAIKGKIAWTPPSDRRLKKDIQDSDLALDFVMKLRPVAYHLIRGNGRQDYGFIAQEVNDALEGRAANMVTRDGDPMQTWMLRQADLISPVVKAIQQQQAVEESQRREIDGLQARLKALKEKLEAMTAKAATEGTR